LPSSSFLAKVERADDVTSFSLLIGKNRKGTPDGYRSDEDFDDDSRPLNNLYSTHNETPIFKWKASTIKKRKQMFVITSLSCDMQRKWKALFDLYVVDTISYSNFMAPVEKDAEVIELWRKTFVTDINETSMPSYPEI